MPRHEWAGHPLSFLGSTTSVRARADPFVKVKAMIKDLIVKSMEQANSGSDKKAYCDTELATNKAAR